MAKVESATRVQAVYPGDSTVHETNRFAVMLPALGPQDAETGDGIWSVAEPPAEAERAAESPPPRASLWQRLRKH